MPFAFMPAPFCSHFLLRETECRNVYVFILYRLYLICFKHLHLQDESSSFPLDLSEVERPWWKMTSCCANDHPFPLQISALIILVGCSTLGIFQEVVLCIHWALNSESRVAMEGKISLVLSYATESVILLHQSISAFQSVRTWSKLQFCSLKNSKNRLR